MGGILILRHKDSLGMSVLDVEKRELLWKKHFYSHFWDVELSKDGSNIFILNSSSTIQALSTWTGEVVGEVEVENDGRGRYLNLYLDGPRIWVWNHFKEYKGWEFGLPGSPFIQLSNQLSNVPPNILHPDGTML